MNIQKKLFQPISSAPLAIFRVGFGLLLFLEGVGAVATGWVRNAFVDPKFTFSFIPFFPWLQPLPGEGMIYYYLIMGSLGVFVMLGLFYRPAILGYFVLWTLAYWMQKTNYNNHYYLLVLLTGIAVFLPAQRYFSLDVVRGAVKRQNLVPQWTSLVFVGLLFIVYSYAALAKVQPDWLQAIPIKIWFASKGEIFLVGPLLVTDWFPYVVAYGGILFDGLIIPAIWWSKTRKFALVVALFFHLFNSLVFQIGIFPYLMLFMSVFFFDPLQVRQFFFPKDKQDLSPDVERYPTQRKPYKLLVVPAMAVFFIVMILLPIRHHLYPGNVNWTEEGHRMSWRMMLRTKSGKASFKVVLPDGREITHLPQMELTPKQVAAMSTRPDMVWQYAQYLKKQYLNEGQPEVSIYADVWASLNGRPYQRLIDSEVDLGRERWKYFESHHWILPFQEVPMP